jgi:hypothetical protein
MNGCLTAHQILKGYSVSFIKKIHIIDIYAIVNNIKRKKKNTNQDKYIQAKKRPKVFGCAVCTDHLSGQYQTKLWLGGPQPRF